jgi:LysM repeat protein
MRLRTASSGHERLHVTDEMIRSASQQYPVTQNDTLSWIHFQKAQQLTLLALRA